MKNKKFVKIFSALAVIVIACAVSFSLAACNDNNPSLLRFSMPDGTPALSAARLIGEKLSIGGKSVDYNLISPDNIAGEMVAGKADVVILPTNTGVNTVINKKAPYKMVSVNVKGNLYVVGRQKNDSLNIRWDDLKGKKVACIGQNGTPGLVFRYIVDERAKIGGIKIGTGPEDINVMYVADAATALPMMLNNEIEYAIVPEPAATAWSLKKDENGNSLGITARMDLQKEYEGVTGFENFPQASMFVKTSLLNDAAFMSALKSALTASVDWVYENPAEVNAYMKNNVKSTSSFPAPSIDRVNVCAEFTDSAGNKAMVLNFLSAIGINADENVFA